MKEKEHTDAAAAWIELVLEGFKGLLYDINQNPALSDFSAENISKIEQGLSGAKANLDEVSDIATIGVARSQLGITEQQRA